MHRAISDANPLARVHQLLAIAFDDTPACNVVWMPAHTTEADVGVKRLGNGEYLSAFHRYGNDEADKWAKWAVQEHRVPEHIRQEIKDLHSKVLKAAKWIGAATWHANHSSGKPGRDTGASRQLAMEATKAARAKAAYTPANSKVKSRAQGGHDLIQLGSIWRCSVCKEWSASRAKMETKHCKGSVSRRWKGKAAVSIVEQCEPAVQHRLVHRIWYSGDIIWCSVCGCYGEHKARGLTTFCQGKFEGIWKGGGRVQQLKKLKSNVHPKTGLPLPRALTEREWLDGKRTSIITTATGGGEPSVHERLDPVRLCRTSAAILARLQLKRLMSQEVAIVEVACKRPRIRIRLKSSLEVVEAAINERDTRRRERADVEGSEPPLLASPRIEGVEGPVQAIHASPRTCRIVEVAIAAAGEHEHRQDYPA